MSECCTTIGSLQNQIIKLQEITQNLWDIYIVSIVKNWVTDDGIYTVTMSDNTTFNIDLSMLNEANVSYNNSNGELTVNWWVYQLVFSANNGLDIDGGNVVFGQEVGEAGDPAKLLSNRELPLNNNHIKFRTGWVAKWDTTIQSDWTVVVWQNLVISSDQLIQNTWWNYNWNKPALWSQHTMNAEIVANKQWIRCIKNVIADSSYNWIPADSIYEFAYPLDTTGAIQRYEAVRWFEYTRDWSWNILQSINILWNSENWIYRLWGFAWPYISSWNSLPPVLSTATTETMAIDTATGQIGRIYSTRIEWSLSWQPDVFFTNTSSLVWWEDRYWVSGTFLNYTLAIAPFAAPAWYQWRWEWFGRVWVNCDNVASDGKVRIWVLSQWQSLSSNTIVWLKTINNSDLNFDFTLNSNSFSIRPIVSFDAWSTPCTSWTPSTNFRMFDINIFYSLTLYKI